ncbi:DUF1631 family protein [Thioalkalicoccus limnaeus]|uniref:DUF1631 family protein n=1 Tax=Thioalkalicoccus limnaeus TaxID=120681 RepID=A0ABV4BAH1_9GAMM
MERSTDGFYRDLMGLFDGFLDRLGDTLSELADRAATNHQASSYLQAMRLVRRYRDTCRDAFRDSLNRHAERLARGRSWPAAELGPEPDDMSLIGIAELEETLAIQKLVAEAEDRYRDLLQALSAGLAEPLNRKTLPLTVNPIGPAVIGAALRRSLAELTGIDPLVKLDLYKLFGTQVMERLAQPYRDCLARTPGGEHRGLGRALSGRPGPTRSRPGETSRPKPDAPAPSGVVPFATLRHLLEERRPRVPAGRLEVAVETGELLAALTRLQRNPVADLEMTDQLRLWVDQALGLDSSRATDRGLGPVDETTLQLVFLLFEHLLSDPMLPDPIKVLIARLQIPTLKVALLDKSFFDDPRHPARCLLNHLAQAAVGWTDDGDRSARSLFGRIESIVERIIGDFGQDLSLFAELDAELATDLAREAELARTWETKARQKAEVKAHNSAAEQAVTIAIRQELQGYRNVPQALAALLEEGWLPVLRAIYLRDGPTSEAWNEALAMSSRLLWSVCPKYTAEERRELLRAIPPMLRQLRLALAAQVPDQHKIARWFKELQALHMTALRGDGDTVPARDASAAEPGHERAPSTPDRPEAEAALPEPLPRLIPGTWIQLDRDEDGKVRMKLIWLTADRQRLLFVDRHGRRAIELAVDELAELIRSGLAVIVGHQDDIIVDRAVAAVREAIET